MAKKEEELENGTGDVVLNGTAEGDHKDESSDKKKQAANKKVEQLSEEDEQLKLDLEMLVERLKGTDASLHTPALTQVKEIIRTSTSSMTAVPKPLKFLGPHFGELETLYGTWPDSTVKRELADVLSVLAMTYGAQGERLGLKYRLQGQNGAPGEWGHEYVRSLAAEMGQEHSVHIAEVVDAPPSEDILKIVKMIVPYFLQHHAEPDAVDLLSDLDMIADLVDYLDENTFDKVTLYMIGCVNLLPPNEDVAFLTTAYEIYMKYNRLSQALTIALRLDDQALIERAFKKTTNLSQKRQFGYMMAKQGVWLGDEDESVDETIRNTKLAEHFAYLIKDLNISEARTPEDIYKSHLENTRLNIGGTIDSASNNLASTFVNGFVNAGFGSDKLILTEDENLSWIYKNKDQGMLSATASIGLLHLWNIDVGLTQLDKYLYSNDVNVMAGAYLGIGILNCNVHDGTEPALALLSEHVESDSITGRVAAIAGLGMAYAGSNREELIELLLPIASDTGLDMQVSSVAVLALGQVCVGSANGDVASMILQTIMERDEAQLKSSWAKLIATGLALLFLTKGEASDAIVETLKAIEHPLAMHARVLVQTASWAGSGNVLEIQQLLHICTEAPDDEDKDEGEAKEGGDRKEEKKDTLYQGLAVLGIALVAMSEDVGMDMVLRQFGHLMHYGEPIIRKAVPLALGLLSASHAQLNIIETLSRYSHDNDLEVAANAIFAMGIVGAGTNNARLAQLLRGLASYYHHEPSHLFMVRLAQV